MTTSDGERQPATRDTPSGSALAVGIGVRPGTEAGRIVRAVRAVVGDTTISCLATLDRRATEPGVLTAAAILGVTVVAFTAEQLAEVDVRHRSDHVSAAVGTPSVAEAAAVLAGSGELVRGRTIADGIVVAASTSPGSPMRGD
ncbi:cobalamin biosynthesis protein [Nocardia sp. NPDC060249]|uniref:cobalamin biosynthesis protein n=1 Tax=Nocardia sp. NPDC060249 TaxID=3347082 RepID=UPI00366892CD